MLPPEARRTWVWYWAGYMCGAGVWGLMVWRYSVAATFIMFISLWMLSGLVVFSYSKYWNQLTHDPTRLGPVSERMSCYALNTVLGDAKLMSSYFFAVFLGSAAVDTDIWVSWLMDH